MTMNDTQRSTPDYSVEYSSSSPSSRTEHDILLPGQQPSKEVKEDDTVIITPTPTEIVIKTRLVKQKYDPFSASNDQSNDSFYVLPSQNQSTKVFINVCVHSIIVLPSQRKSLDENGQEIDAWRLPMSMGDLRPFIDKAGNACIAADCIMNPKIVEDMKGDPAHFHFVCDLIIQCAERKFQHTHFGGRSLERSFKLPKMKYAAYVDERTNLSINPKAVGEVIAPSQPVVAKQRVKRSGGKTNIIEEIQPTQTGSTDPIPLLPKVRIELFITTEENEERIPLLDLFRDIVDAEASLCSAFGMVSNFATREENLSESQMLKIPLQIKNCEASVVIAECSFKADLPRSDLPDINVSTFLLTLSETATTSATECVLPFAVDTHQISARYENKSGMLRLSMPILQSAIDFEKNADPGTRQWEIQNAFRMKSRDGSSTKDKECNESSRSTYSQKDSGPCVDNDEINDDNDVLPEDAFHSQDFMSRHLLQQQEEVQKAQQQKSIGREGAETEYIDVDELKHHTTKSSEECRDLMFQKVSCCQNSGNLAFSLV